MSSASPLVASTSCQPPNVSWRLYTIEGWLIGTLLQRLHIPIGNHHCLAIILFVATSADCQQAATAHHCILSAAHPNPHHC
jgi:hypothetical protein